MLGALPRTFYIFVEILGIAGDRIIRRRASPFARVSRRGRQTLVGIVSSICGHRYA